MIGEYGQTVGKMVIKIKVLDYPTEEDIGFTQSFKREAIPFLLVILSTIVVVFLRDEMKSPNYELTTFMS